MYEKGVNKKVHKTPADVVFIIRDNIHPLFKPEGNYIIYTISISLKEIRSIFF